MSRRRFTLLLLILTSITLLTLDFRGFSPLEGTRSKVLGVFAPVGDFFGGILHPVGEAWNGATGYDEVKAENDRLKQQVDDLEGRLANGQASQQELDELKRQLGISFVGEIPRVNARVASGAISNYDETIEIDKGGSAGVKKTMAVITGAGLVGHTEVVDDNRSTVRLITEKGQQLGVKIPGKPRLGILSGQGDGNRVRVELPFEAEVSQGDVLVTAGGRSIYPPDIPVGRVVSVQTNEAALKKEADVDLLANFNDLQYVTVLLREPPP